MTWDEAVAFALALPGAERSTSYGLPAAKANGNAFLSVGHEPATSFVLRLDHGTIDLMMALHPETFWKTPHYAGHPAVLVRYDTVEDGLVRAMIGRACEQARTKRRPRKR